MRSRPPSAVTPAQVQLDVKTHADALSAVALERFARLLRDNSAAFVASAYEWRTVSRLVAVTPGLHAGFDPLAFYPRSLSLDAAGFRAVAARTRATAPGASIYYLEAKLILAALAQGVDFVRELPGTRSMHGRSMPTIHTSRTCCNTSFGSAAIRSRATILTSLAPIIDAIASNR